MSQSKDEKHLSTLPLRHKSLEDLGRRLTQRDGLNRVPSPAADPEGPAKLNNKHAAIHEPDAMAGPPDNSWPGMESGTDSIVNYSQIRETRGLGHQHHSVSILGLPVALQPGGQAGEGLALSLCEDST